MQECSTQHEIKREREGKESPCNHIFVLDERVSKIAWWTLHLLRQPREQVLQSTRRVGNVKVST